MAILRFSKWQPSAMLDSKNLHFSSRSPSRPAVLLPHAKLRWNRTIGKWFMAKKRFSRWRPPPSWISKISIFGHVTVTGFNIWCSVPNFIKIGQFFTDIMAILRFWKWRPSAMLDSKNLQFLSRSPCRPAVLLTHTKFCWNRTIGRWFMAKKRFSRWWP